MSSNRFFQKQDNIQFIEKAINGITACVKQYKIDIINLEAKIERLKLDISQHMKRLDDSAKIRNDHSITKDDKQLIEEVRYIEQPTRNIANKEEDIERVKLGKHMTRLLAKIMNSHLITEDDEQLIDAVTCIEQHRRKIANKKKDIEMIKLGISKHMERLDALAKIRNGHPITKDEQTLLLNMVELNDPSISEYPFIEDTRLENKKTI